MRDRRDISLVLGAIVAAFLALIVGQAIRPEKTQGHFRSLLLQTIACCAG